MWRQHLIQWERFLKTHLMSLNLSTSSDTGGLLYDNFMILISVPCCVDKHCFFESSSSISFSWSFQVQKTSYNQIETPVFSDLQHRFQRPRLWPRDYERRDYWCSNVPRKFNNSSGTGIFFICSRISWGRSSPSLKFSWSIIENLSAALCSS